MIGYRATWAPVKVATFGKGSFPVCRFEFGGTPFQVVLGRLTKHCPFLAKCGVLDVCDFAALTSAHV